MNQPSSNPTAESKPSGSEPDAPPVAEPEVSSSGEASAPGSSPTAPSAAQMPAATEPPSETKPAPAATKAKAAKTTPAGAAKKRARTAAAPSATPSPEAPKSAGQWWWGTGRRKTAVARVRIRPGDGKFMVNKRAYADYFTEERDRKDLMGVLAKTNTASSLEIHVNVGGGGYTGQAGAIVLGLGRALLKYDQVLEPILRSNGFLTRDPRKVERKKYGQPGARKRFQFSKR